MPHPVAVADGRGGGHVVAAGAVVGDAGEVDPGAPDELVGGGEAVVALDQLQAAVAGVALELDVAHAPQPDAREEAQAELRDLGMPVDDLVGRQPEVDREAGAACAWSE